MTIALIAYDVNILSSCAVHADGSGCNFSFGFRSVLSFFVCVCCYCCYFVFIFVCLFIHSIVLLFSSLLVVVFSLFSFNLQSEFCWIIFYFFLLIKYYYCLLSSSCSYSRSILCIVYFINIAYIHVILMIVHEFRHCKCSGMYK